MLEQVVEGANVEIACVKEHNTTSWTSDDVDYNQSVELFSSECREACSDFFKHFYWSYSEFSQEK